jgi:hypothetical protein
VKTKLHITQAMIGWSSLVPSPKSRKTESTTGRPTRKPLSVRYAEVLKLRLAVEQTLQSIKSPQTDRRHLSRK